MLELFSTGLFVFILIMTVVVHEVAHAWAADLLGDPTARIAGRLTLNPVPHLDPIGSILVPLIAGLTTGIGFGWAKPVPYNPYNISHKYGDLLVAGAGPLSNVVLAILSGIIVRLGVFSGSPFESILGMIVLINVSLALFNLIPVPPLDGSKILGTFLPARMRHAFLNPGFGGIPLVLLAIFFIWPLLSPLVYSISNLILAK